MNIVPTMSALVLAASLVGCGANPTPHPQALHDQDPQMSLAERELRAGRPVDYTLPFSGPAPLRTVLAARFHEPCIRGDRHACWVEANYSGVNGAGDYTRVAANCRAGDKTSCRALPIPVDGQSSYPDLPGAMGRSPACEAPQKLDDCDSDALERECRDGFRISCLAILVYDEDSEPRIRPVFTRVSEEDCNNDIADACNPLIPALATRTCALTDQCSDLGLSLEHLDPTRARNALEQDCQYRQVKVICAELAVHYLNGKWPEPVVGRGAALWDWSCQPADSKDMCRQLSLDLKVPND